MQRKKNSDILERIINRHEDRENSFGSVRSVSLTSLSMKSGFQIPLKVKQLFFPNLGEEQAVTSEEQIPALKKLSM